MVAIRLAAVADIHSPLLFKHFRESVYAMNGIDAFIMAGDMIYKGNSE
jgi:predicted phosphodiesterase